jgi:uncharacterized protein
MPTSRVSVSAQAARRLELRRQHLEGRRPRRATRRDILRVVRDIAFVQIDPVTIVGPSHLISLWARVGTFPASDLDRLVWRERKLFPCWTHGASYVPIEDYPIHSAWMRRFPDSLSKSWGYQKAEARVWIPAHSKLRQTILRELKAGPLPLSEFRDHVPGGKKAVMWAPSSDVDTMLSYLQLQGEVMVVGHRGTQNLYGLAPDFLPGSVDRADLTQTEAERLGVVRTLGAIGVATPTEINRYLLRGRYLQLTEDLERLVGESILSLVEVEGLRGIRYALTKDLDALSTIADEDWPPEISLIPPFDNMVYEQRRGVDLHGFNYIREQFFPEHKRKFGTYVLPILWGDRFIGRIDPRMDRTAQRLEVKAVHVEPGAPREKTVGVQLAERIAELARFFGTDDVAYTGPVPDSWRSVLR